MKAVFFLKATLVSLLIFSSGVCVGQENPLFDEIKPFKNRFIISGLNLINPINPAVQIGFERTISERYAVQAEVGLIPERSLIGYFFVDVLGADDQYWYTFNGIHLRGEVKRFWKGVESRYLKPYYACEIFYMNNTSNVNSTFILDDSIDPAGVAFYNGDGLYDDFYTIYKKKIGAQFKIGFIEKINARWSTEMYVGLGLAVRNTTESGRLFPKDELAFSDVHFTNLTGQRVVVQVPLNIKFSYSY